MDIDVVITWVDGKDKKHKKKLKKHLKSKRKEVPGADKTRFRSVNEIKYCVLSILKFAPFVRNIYIVTDNQKPNLSKYINKLYPNKINSIKVVDHKEIFEGYEEYLPTFNSLSIETFLWRIKGLSDNFVYFNDDLFLVGKVNPTDWFRKGRPVMRGRWKTKPFIRLFWKEIIRKIKKISIKSSENINLKPTFYVSQWWGAKILGFKNKFFRFEHTPHPIDKRELASFFKTNKDVFLKNANYKFRHYDQYNTVALANHLEIRKGDFCTEQIDAVYLKPVNRGENYVNRKIKLCENNERVKFLCAQSLDEATKEDKKKLLKWLMQLIKK